MIGVLIGTILSCSAYDDQIELSKDVVWRYYSITPDTILTSLVQGNTNVFAPLAATPEGELPSPKKLVLWEQDEFFLVAETIHKQSWGETLGDQNLYSMSFTTDCAYGEIGTFRSAEFLSFKVVATDAEEARLEYWISIWPSIDLLYTVEGVYQPNVKYKVPIAISQYQVTASEALHIAEEMGGSEIRAKAGNDCKISVTATGTDEKIWQVLYYPDGFTRLFEILINAQTGDYNIIYPKAK